MTDRPAPSTLWHQADQEHPHDVEARRARFLELMRDHGHIIPKDHPDASPSPNLPCGWPHHPEDT